MRWEGETGIRGIAKPRYTMKHMLLKVQARTQSSSPCFKFPTNFSTHSQALTHILTVQFRVSVVVAESTNRMLYGVPICEAVHVKQGNAIIKVIVQTSVHVTYYLHIQLQHHY